MCSPTAYAACWATMYLAVAVGMWLVATRTRRRSPQSSGKLPSMKLVDDSALFQQMSQTTARELAVCTRYRPNVHASFGECVCGRPRADHSEQALRAAGQYASPKTVVRDEKKLRERMTRRETVECTAYRPNLKGSFGECVCGAPRAAHSDAALQAGGAFASPKPKVDESELREQMTRRETVDCTAYRVNLQARNVGECMCGAPRAAHSDAALQAASENVTPAKAVDEVALREKMTRRETVECTAYRPNLQGSFGECVCGAPRAAHSAAALQAASESVAPKKVVDEAALREQMARRAMMRI